MKMDKSKMLNLHRFVNAIFWMQGHENAEGVPWG